jgi:hypothetical protein
LVKQRSAYANFARLTYPFETRGYVEGVTTRTPTLKNELSRMDPQAEDNALLRLDLYASVAHPFLNANATLESCARTGENSH